MGGKWSIDDKEFDHDDFTSQWNYDEKIDWKNEFAADLLRMNKRKTFKNILFDSYKISNSYCDLDL